MRRRFVVAADVPVSRRVQEIGSTAQIEGFRYPIFASPQLARSMSPPERCWLNLLMFSSFHRSDLGSAKRNS
jgi:hypothetical protein